MITTTYGYRNPETGDKAKGTSGWMASYNFNVTRVDAHSHNGIDSAQLSVASFSAQTVSLAAASWVASGLAVPYKQTATMPAAITDFDNVLVRFKISSGSKLGEEAYLHYIRTSATTVDVYCSDNTLNILMILR